MTALPATLTLSPAEEARRLWAGAREARREAGDSLVRLCEAIDLAVRALEILTVDRLRPARDRFPATVGLFLETPVAEIDPARDAIAAPRCLELVDVIDLLGQESLPCASPRLHRGWEDRVFSCRRSRQAAQEVVGLTLDTRRQQSLLLVAAYRNRLFRYPPPVTLVPGEILPALDEMAAVVEGLLERAGGREG